MLGGYSSAILLAITAVIMTYESVGRIISPVAIAFNEAIIVAVIGLAVNVGSARMLHASGRRGHDDQNGHDEHHHHDHNLRAAYLHVIADALTSVLAIVALVCGKFFGWAVLDPLLGIVGACLIGRWAWGLLKETAAVLLDESAPADMVNAAAELLEGTDDTHVVDLHLWRLRNEAFSLMAVVVTSGGLSPKDYAQRLQEIPRLEHVNIEVHNCTQTM